MGRNFVGTAWEFIKRNKGKLAIGTGILGGLGLLKGLSGTGIEIEDEEFETEDCEETTEENNEETEEEA